MGQPEGMRMVPERTEGHISSQAIENRSPEKKIAMEQEQSNNTRTIASTGILLEGPKNNEESKYDGEIMETEKTTVDSPKTEEAHYRGIPKPPIIHVFTRRGKKQEVSEASNNVAMIKSGIPKPPIIHVYTRRGKKQEVSEAVSYRREHKKELN